MQKIKIANVRMLPKIGKNGPMLSLDNVSSVVLLWETAVAENVRPAPQPRWVKFAAKSNPELATNAGFAKSD